MQNKKRRLLLGLVFILSLAIVVLSCLVYQKIFYYTQGPQAPFPQLIYAAPPFPEIPDGVWLHRVNSPERLRHFLHDYSGFEMDVYYDDQRDSFNVDHDNRDFGTTLDDMLAVLKEKSDAYLWLDVKNLNAQNTEHLHACLDVLLRKHGINKMQILIESPAVELLSAYASAGYLTSFYLWPKAGMDAQGQINELRARFYRSGAAAVSTDLVYYDLAKAAFPGVPLLFWDMKSYSRKPLTWLASSLRRHLLFRDSQVKVLLVGDRNLRR